MRSLQLLMVTLVAAGLGGQRAASQDAPRSPQRYALLIGVNDYTYLSDLRFCDNDMIKLREALLVAGFPEANVAHLRVQADRPELIPHRNNVLDQLEILLNGVQEDDLVVVAFSGHGVHLGGADYFCTIDSKLEDPTATMVPVATVAQLLKDSAAKQKVLIVDSCRNDPLPEGTRSAGDRSLSTSFVRSIADRDAASAGFVVMASCAEHQVSVEDPELQHGVFMNFVANGLLGHADADRNQEVSLLELHQYAEYETRNHVRVTRSMLQTPNLRGDITGNYVLARVGERPKTLDLVHVKKTRQDGDPSPIELKLYDLAYAKFQQGKTAEAITEFQQLLAVTEHQQMKRIAGLKLASAYLALDPVSNIKKALELQREVGIDSISLVVQNTRADIKSNKEVRGVVKKGQIVGVTEAVGDWFRVESIDGNELPKEKVGFLFKTAFQEPTQPAASSNQANGNRNGARSNAAANPSYASGYGYGYGNSGGYAYTGGSGAALGAGGAGGGGIGAYADVHPTDRANYREIDRLEAQYDRALRSGASEARLQNLENQALRQERQLEMRQMRRERLQPSNGGQQGGFGGQRGGGGGFFRQR